MDVFCQVIELNRNQRVSLVLLAVQFRSSLNSTVSKILPVVQGKMEDYQSGNHAEMEVTRLTRGFQWHSIGQNQWGIWRVE